MVIRHLVLIFIRFAFIRFTVSIYRGCRGTTNRDQALQGQGIYKASLTYPFLQPDECHRHQ